MEILEKIDVSYIKMGVLIIFALGHFIVNRKNNLKLKLQYQLYSYGIMTLLLTLTIPNVFSGYPVNIPDLEDKKMLLYHLQKNNDALSETTQVVREMALLTFLLMVSVISIIIKHLKIDNSPQ